MSEHLSLVKELIQLEPNKEELLKLIQESYLLDQKYYFFSRFFDQTRIVVKDIDNLKRAKVSKKSILFKSINMPPEINDKNFPMIKREIIDKYNYYITGLVINNLIRQERRKSFFRYTTTTLLTIISIILAFIAKVISN